MYYPIIYGDIISCSKDPSQTTRIQWNVTSFFFWLTWKGKGVRLSCLTVSLVNFTLVKKSMEVLAWKKQTGAVLSLFSMRMKHASCMCIYIYLYLYSMYVDIIYSQYIYIYSIYPVQIYVSMRAMKWIGAVKKPPQLDGFFYTGVVHGFHELRIPKPLRILPTRTSWNLTRFCFTASGVFVLQ